MRYSKVLILCLLFVLCFSTVCYGLTSTTYNDLSQSSTTAQNLISYAANFDGFLDSDYVVYQGEQYSYYIVWGDLSYSDGRVSGSDVEYVQYYREGVSGDYSYTYLYNTDDLFSLDIENAVVSNIQGAGGASVLFNQFYFYEYALFFLILILGVSFASVLVRR